MTEEQPPLYYELCAAPFSFEFERAKQHVDRVEKLLRANDWPLGNDIDVIQRHVEYRRWYPAERAHGGDPTALAYRTLARLLTYDEIRYALEHMDRLDPWSGPDDFGPDPFLEEVVGSSSERMTIERDGYNLSFGTKSLLESLSDAELALWRQWAPSAALAPLWRYMENRITLQNLMTLAQSLLRNQTTDAKRMRAFGGVGQRIEQIYQALVDVPRQMHRVEEALIQGDATVVAPESPIALNVAGTWLRAYSGFLDRIQARRLSANHEADYQVLVHGGGARAERTKYRQSYALAEFAVDDGLDQDVANSFVWPFIRQNLYQPAQMDALVAEAKAAAAAALPTPVQQADYKFPKLDAIIRSWLYAGNLMDFLGRSAEGLQALQRLNEAANDSFRIRANGLRNSGGQIPSFFRLGENLVPHARDAGPWPGYWIPMEETEDVLRRVQLGWQRIFDNPEAETVATDFPQQPLWIERVQQRYVLDQHRREELVQTIRDPGVHLDRITWKDNSCWLDSMMLALFGIDTAPPATRFLRGNVRSASVPIVRLHMDNGQEYVEERCSAEDMQGFYDLLITDIVQLQADPVAPKCVLGIRRLWNNCAIHRVPDRDYGDPDAVIKSLIDAFQLQDVWQLQEPDEELDLLFGPDATLAMQNEQLVIDARPTQAGKEVFAYFTTWSVGFRFKNRASEGSLTFRVEQSIAGHLGYYLGAVIMSAGGGHFTTYVRDISKVEKQWTYINVASNGQNFTHTYEVLPPHVYNLTRANRGQEKPVVYLYFPLP
jgi:hypothetical protein